MKRPIKFRAWDKRGKQMILTISQLHLESGMIVGHCGKDETWVLNDKNQYTLMQYTGLIDKNGKEIYEGDVVKIDCGYSGDRFYKECIAIIKYDAPGFYTHNIKEKDGVVWQDACHYFEDFEIIGNIWENPELIS